MYNIKKYDRFLESNSNFPNIKKIFNNGFTIMIGKDSKSNDYLTFKETNDDDFWFHVKDLPGSHVVIKINSKLPTKEDIRFVAELAKKNSKGKNKKDVKVIYCKKKFVTKTKEMLSGQVNVDEKNAEFIKV